MSDPTIADRLRGWLSRHLFTPIDRTEMDDIDMQLQRYVEKAQREAHPGHPQGRWFVDSMRVRDGIQRGHVFLTWSVDPDKHHVWAATFDPHADRAASIDLGEYATSGTAMAAVDFAIQNYREAH